MSIVVCVVALIGAVLVSLGWHQEGYMLLIVANIWWARLSIPEKD